MTEVKVIWVEKTDFQKGMSIKAHTHNYYQLYNVISGKYTFRIDNNLYELERGSCIVVPPNKTHEIKRVENDITKTFEIKFAVFDKDLENDLVSLEKPTAVDSISEFFISYIMNNGRSRLPYLIHCVEHYLPVLIYHMTQDMHEISAAQSNSQLIDTTGFSKVTIDIIIYLEENYTEEVTLEKIAKHVDYQKNYVCYVFKKDTGITIIDYLNFVRIRHAAEFFSYSDIDISQVCRRVGFVSISHFNHTFKKLVGMPPGHYRRMFPADIYGYLNEGNSGNALITNQIQTIAEIFGTLPISVNNEEKKD